MRRCSLLIILSILLLLTGCNYTIERRVEDMETIFNCNAQPITKQMNSAEITQLYKRSLADGKQAGYTPVIVFVNDTLEESIGFNIEKAGSLEAYAKSVLSKDHSHGKDWLDNKYSKLDNDFGGDLLSIDEEYLDVLLSKPKKSDASSFIPSASAFEGEAYLIQVPTTDPYEIFAYLPFCGWNDCPSVDDMISICKYWYDTYGAIPTTITYDTLTFYLDKPISDKDTAIKTAKEQCAFCSEVIGMGGLESYIEMTYNSSSWTFWWD